MQVFHHSTYPDTNTDKQPLGRKIGHSGTESRLNPAGKLALRTGSGSVTKNNCVHNVEMSPVLVLVLVLIVLLVLMLILIACWFCGAKRSWVGSSSKRRNTMQTLQKVRWYERECWPYAADRKIAEEYADWLKEVPETWGEPLG